ncbi:unnamed protein product [Mytilus edulis]|uniref:Uncharacterized protein n=1 Tax=Mytilus edulis TaxID=6550 RepID=A0A8S3VH81_MYTED|nr:unnamed protein product [Mytilus edulis]
MPAVKCPVPDCQYETDDLDAVVVAALLTTHATVHSAAAGAIVSAKVEKLLECCDETLRRDITRSAGGSLVDKSEQEVLAAMRTLTVREENTMVDSCGYCGKKGHGKSAPPKIRQKECPAYGHTCKKCERDNHYESVCRSNTSKPKVKQNEESESAVFDSLCAATVSPLGKRTIQLDHHLYSQMYNTWIKRPSQPQPFINIVVKVVEDDYKQLGFQNSLVSQQRSTVIPAMADTGCQSCLAGIKVLYKIGLTKRDLIPDQDKNELETRQIVYITDSSDKFFLSKEACITLGIISENFPTIGEITGSVTDTSALKNDENRFTTQIDCNCPKRQTPPPIPVKLPFPPTEENVPKLQNFLLEHYKSSTFNTCEHQPLPLMEGPPLKLMIDPKATPVACHTPVPVPLHWQDDVKASLDQDVRLGVIEPVPVGEPVTFLMSIKDIRKQCYTHLSSISSKVHRNALYH